LLKKGRKPLTKLPDFEFGAGPVDSEPYRSPGECFHPCAHFVVCRCPDVCVHCANVPELLEQPNTTCRPSLIRQVAQLSQRDRATP